MARVHFVSQYHFWVQEFLALLYVTFKYMFFAGVIFYQLEGVEAHGRLMDPPGRNSEWRQGFPNPVNYNDNELFCGGRNVQWQSNGGKCGLCGDAFHLPKPRPHEDGGKYANGIIVRRYTTGQDIDVEVELTSNHMGVFRIKLCPYNGNVDTLSQECLDQHCLIQWTYTTANTWGTCENGTWATGCGPQETFVNCADVAITSNTGTGFGPSGVSTNATGHKHYVYKNNPYMLYYKDYSKSGSPIVPLIVRSQVCLGTGLYRNVKGMENWCQKNCLRYPPSCPADKCKCLKDCRALPPFSEEFGSDQFCLDKCLVFPSKCPKDKCKCI